MSLSSPLSARANSGAKSRERVSGGLGVGMAVTKEIIDRHRGYISVDSELGRGTTFALHIPREQRLGGLSYRRESIEDTGELAFDERQRSALRGAGRVETDMDGAGS